MARDVADLNSGTAHRTDASSRHRTRRRTGTPRHRPHRMGEIEWARILGLQALAGAAGDGRVVLLCRHALDTHDIATRERVDAILAGTLADRHCTSHGIATGLGSLLDVSGQ